MDWKRAEPWPWSPPPTVWRPSTRRYVGPAASTIIEVPVPDYSGRLAILQVCLAKMKTRGDLGNESLAEATAGYSGAELAALCREAGLLAIRKGLARGLAAHQLVVSRQDLTCALAALPAKRCQPSKSSPGPS
jgi:ATP-dependent 26S proteasome regulatory subunit